MMILNQNEAKLANEDTTTISNPGSTSGIYFTAVKVVQCRQVEANMREKKEKKVTEKKTAT